MTGRGRWKGATWRTASLEMMAVAVAVASAGAGAGEVPYARCVTCHQMNGEGCRCGLVCADHVGQRQWTGYCRGRGHRACGNGHAYHTMDCRRTCRTQVAWMGVRPQNGVGGFTGTGT